MLGLLILLAYTTHTHGQQHCQQRCRHCHNFVCVLLRSYRSRNKPYRLAYIAQIICELMLAQNKTQGNCSNPDTTNSIASRTQLAAIHTQGLPEALHNAMVSKHSMLETTAQRTTTASAA